MNKKLMAVAVAGALAAPGIAMAQSSVTISGYFKVGVDNLRVTGGTANPTAANNATTHVNRTKGSEGRVTDHSSRILFNVTEDLGGGLQAIGQMDTRFNPSDIAQAAGNGFPAVVGGGNTWVGLRSKSMGTLTLGRHDLHYGKAGDDTAAKAGSLLMIADSLFGSVGGPNLATTTAAAGTTGRSLAGQTRTNNAVRWDSPQWGMFSGTFAWSSNPLQISGGNNVEGDLHLADGTSGAAGTGVIGTGPNSGARVTRKGAGWNLNPKLTGSNWFAEWSHWRAKQDTNNANTMQFTISPLQGTAGSVAAAAVQHDQKSDVLAGFYRFGAFKLGLAWNRGKTTDPASGLVSGDRTSWSIPMSYTWGQHSVAGHYTKNRDGNSVQVGYSTVALATTAAGNAGQTASGTNQNTVSGANTGAHMWAIAYDYSLSKRTSAGLSFAQLRNKSAATYSMFYNAQTAFGSANSGSLAGEDSRLLAATIRHNF